MNKKKLVGVYLPVSLIIRLKTFIFKRYTKAGIDKSQSEVIEEAVTQYLDKEERR